MFMIAAQKLVKHFLQKFSHADDDDEELFCDMVTDERRLALFPVGTTVRDPHHLESPTIVFKGLIIATEE